MVPRRLHFVSRGLSLPVNVKNGKFGFGSTSCARLSARLEVEAEKKDASISFYPDGHGINITFIYESTTAGTIARATVVGGPDEEGKHSQADFAVFLEF